MKEDSVRWEKDVLVILSCFVFLNSEMLVDMKNKFFMKNLKN